MNDELNEVQEIADYGVTVDNVWDVYDKLIDILGGEDLCEQLAKAMGNDELIGNLRYIVRMNDLEEEIANDDFSDDYDVDDNYDDVNDFEEM